MKKSRPNSKLLLPALALAAGLCAAPGAQADGPIFRLSADFFKFNGSEFFTDATAVAGRNDTTPGTPDGALFFRKRVRVAQPSNTLYVSIFTTGDSHGGAALWLSCRAVPQAAPGVAPFCRPGIDTGVDQAPSGWISKLKLPLTGLTATTTPATNCNNGGGGSADCHDNDVTYQWCIPVRSGQVVTVDLKMATSKPGGLPGNRVFLEKGHVFIDSSFIEQPDRCLQAPAVGSSGAALTAAEKAGEVIAGSTSQDK